MRTVVGLFNRIEEAQGAVKMLRGAGFEKEYINLIARDAKGEYQRHLEGSEGEYHDIREGTAAGAGAGAVLGGLGGLLIGLGALAIPGIGAAIAAGPIASTLIGATAGAMTGGIVGALAAMGIPKEHAEAYAEGIRRGGTLVTVHTQDNRANDAVQILEHFNPVDINERVQDWRSTSWKGFDDTAEPFEWDEVVTSQREEIPVTGREPPMDSPVMEQERTAGRHPDKMPDGGDDFGRSFTRDFRSHFDLYYAAQGMDYNDVMPAYRYGDSLARDRRFHDYDWDTIEQEARVAWEGRYGQNTWNRIRDAVRHGWDQARH